MYVNEIATTDTAYSKVHLVFQYPATLIWVRCYAGVNKGKDYPAAFTFSSSLTTASLDGCALSKITTYHKYNNTQIDVYQIAQISKSSMILTASQQDLADPSYTHKIEYRFVPEQ